MPRVTVALVGDPASPDVRPPDEEFEKAWDERPQITLDVPDEEVLASVVQRAVAEFGVAPSEYHSSPLHLTDLGLYRPDRPTTVEPGPFVVVDEDGRAFWNVYDFQVVPYAQLVRSVQASAMEGDPQRLYLILRGPPTGNGEIVDWQTLMQIVEMVRVIGHEVAAAGGVYAAAKAVIDLVRKRAQQGRESLDRNYHRWAQRGAFALDFGHFIRRRDAWVSDDLARLLGCTSEDADAILALFGFALDDEEGVWRRDGDHAATLLASAFEEVTWAGDLTHTRPRLEARITKASRNGRAVARADVRRD